VSTRSTKSEYSEYAFREPSAGLPPSTRVREGGGRHALAQTGQRGAVGAVQTYVTVVAAAKGSLP
jgi:hypothetical protein